MVNNPWNTKQTKRIEKPGPLELVQVNVCLLRWLREQKTQNSFEFQNAQRGTTNFAVILKLVLKILLIY